MSKDKGKRADFRKSCENFEIVDKHPMHKG